MGNILMHIDNVRSTSLYKTISDGEMLSVGLSKLIDEGGEYTAEIVMVISKVKRKRMIDWTFRTDGRTHLHMSLVHNASAEVVNLLYQSRADVNRQDADGITPFILAVMLNQGSNVNILKKRAKLAITTAQGNTAFSFAVKEMHESNIKTLVKAKCDVNVRNGDGDTTLHTMVKNRRPQMCRFLLTNGAKLNCCDAMQRSPIALAVSMKDDKLLRALLMTKRVAYHPQTGLEVKKKEQQKLIHENVMAETLGAYDFFGDTPLLIAAKLEWEYGVSMLLVHKADPDQPSATNPSYTPLIAALSPPNTAVCKLLLQGLANPNDVNADTNHLRINNTHNATTASCQGHPLMLAIKNQDKNATKLLCAHKADVRDALLQAAQGTRPRFVHRMMKLKADLGAKDVVNGLTPLHIACGTGCDESIILLLRGKADVHAVDVLGWTPLMHYLRQDHPMSWQELEKQARNESSMLDEEYSTEDEEESVEERPETRDVRQSWWLRLRSTVVHRNANNKVSNTAVIEDEDEDADEITAGRGSISGVAKSGTAISPEEG